ncbi:MAG: glutamyl-tRNA reductase [Planctomycetota bacterium]|jgi:glutamyl-tRNA reductase
MAADLPVVVGIDHHRAPIELRERVAVAPADHGAILDDLREGTGVNEAVALSTCNRCEFYLAGSIEPDAIIRQLAERQGVTYDDLRAHCFIHRQQAAVSHLLRVTASLESMVVGEYQIMHQVRQAYEFARTHGATGSILNHYFQRALSVGKEVRSETGIGRYKLSMASIAVDLTEHIHGDLSRCRLLVLGAGEMAELAVRHFVERGVRTLTLINRNRERALRLQEQETDRATIHVATWADLHNALCEHDVVLASTAANHAVVTRDLVERCIGKRRLTFIDLAVPRDVEASVADIDNAFLYNVDHLEQVVAANRQLRSEEVDEAAALVAKRVDEAIVHGDQHRGELRRDVAGFFAELVSTERERLNGKLNDEDSDVAGSALHRLANKVQHRVHRYLASREGDQQAQELVRELLGLD